MIRCDVVMAPRAGAWSGGPPAAVSVQPALPGQAAKPRWTPAGRGRASPAARATR